MRLRPNEFCPIHRSTSCCGRELMPRPRAIRLGVQRIEDPHHPRGYRELRSPAEMRKLLNRKRVSSRAGSAPSATKSSRITTISYRTTGNRKEWAARGGMTIQTTCKQHTGGAMKRKDQPGLTTDGRLDR